MSTWENSQTLYGATAENALTCNAIHLMSKKAIDKAVISSEGILAHMGSGYSLHSLIPDHVIL